MGGEMPDADGKSRGADSSSASYGYPPSAPPQQQHQYGTFGPPSGGSGAFPQPAVGVPQPAPPPGMQHYQQPLPSSYAVYPPPPQQQPYAAAAPYYAQGYQAVQGIRGILIASVIRILCFFRWIHLIGSIEIFLLICDWWLIKYNFSKPLEHTWRKPC